MADGSYTITSLDNSKKGADATPLGQQSLKVADFDLDYGSLLRFKVDGGEKLVQFVETKEELHFSFYHKGAVVETQVYDASQYRYKKYMAPPKKVNYAKSVLSPMPGAIVSISVEPGQVVADGQELLIIEAMKMQNIIKSQVEGKIKKILIKPGDSVAVDQLLIEYE
jgi:propionyl-CoA carboxylase alpha chain